MAQSSIEWTEMTWNPTTGCNKVSSGCKFCYAEIMTRRLKAMGQDKYKDGFKLRIHPETLKLPYTWKKPQIVFVDSMSDLFHEKVPLDFIKKVFEVMNDNSQHIFQVLTKRSVRLLELSDQLQWTSNIWMGVSIEDKKVLNRIDHLRETKAHVKFLSCEPLLDDLGEINLSNINWVIVGGESGPKARPMKKEWVLSIQKQANKQNTPFFFKQWGVWGEDGVKRNKKANGKLIDGMIYQKMPNRI